MDTNPPPPRRHSNPVPWIATACVAIAGIGLAAFLQFCHSADIVAEIPGKIIDAGTTIIKEAPEIAARFKTGTITHTFVDQNTEISSTKGDVLELATIRQDETFTKEDSKSVLWDWVNLGTTTSEIRAPVTFRYHLRLSDPWKLATRDNVCLVLAPSIRPSQPPAIHTEQMVKKTEADWLRFNEDESIAELERQMTLDLEKRAADSNHLRLAREACRQSVAGFVKNWLMREERWRQDRLTSIVVVFPDEVKVNSDADLENLQKDPTVHLDKKN